VTSEVSLCLQQIRENLERIQLFDRAEQPGSRGVELLSGLDQPEVLGLSQHFVLLDLEIIYGCGIHCYLQFCFSFIFEKLSIDF